MTKLRYEEFKDRIDIDAFEDAIGFQPMRTDRGNDIGHCIFPDNHSNGDTTGKMGIHRDKLVYNCWVCDGGSLLSLVMELYDLDLDDATLWLYQFTQEDSSRTDQGWTDFLYELLVDVEERAATMPFFNERVLGRFDGPVDYFRTRGISDEVIEQYRLCYGETVMRAAPVKHVEGEVIKKGEDYYGPAAIFPHYWQKTLVGWQYRWMDWDEQHTATPKWLPKYTNTTSFPKQTTLFNYDAVLKVKEPIVVVESVPTVLVLASYGIPAVSYFGSHPTPQQLRLLRKFNQGVILAPDNDPTGDRLITGSAPYLLNYLPGKVWAADPVPLGPKADLGDYVTACGDHGDLEGEDPEAVIRYHLKHLIHKITPQI